MDTMSNVLDLIAVPAFVIDVVEGRTIFRRLNAAHEAMTGLQTADIAGKTPSDLFPARLAQTLTDNYLRVVHSRAAYSYEELLDLSKGEEWWQTTLMPVLGPAGEVVQIIGTGINITQQKRAEIERLEEVARAHALNEEIEETIALAAHDLRSPLQSLQAMLRLLKKDFVDLQDGKRAILDAMEAIGSKAVSLVEEMVLYRDTGAFAPVIKRFDVGHICCDIVALLDPMSKHFVHFNHVEVESDALALQIALRNLVDNAIRHGDRRELMVAIDVAEDEPGILTFTVGDNGNGLSDPERVSDQEAEGKFGPGYGLRGVRRLVRSRGGDVWLGKPIFTSGATIHFTLPGQIVGERMVASARHAA